MDSEHWSGPHGSPDRVGEWGAGAGRMRRRCRSEGLERSPYLHTHHPLMFNASEMATHDEARGPYSSPQPEPHHVHISAFPQLNGLEVPLPVAHLDYSQHRHMLRNQRASPTRSPKTKESHRVHRQTSPILRHEDRLPRVEELFEKLEPPPDLMDFEPKLPLKSILNNPRKSPPPGILKKKKNTQEKEKGEGRRRQRAMSESEYNYADYETNRMIQETRLQNALTYMKRLKDNSGMPYTGQMEHKLQSSPLKAHTSPVIRQSSPVRQQPSPVRQQSSTVKTQTSPVRQHASPARKEWVNGDVTRQESVLRTTAIRREESGSPVSPPPPPPPEPQSSTGAEQSSRSSLKKRKKRAKKMRGHKPEPADLEIQVISPPASPEGARLRDDSPEKTDSNGVASDDKIEPSTHIPYELSSCVRPSLFPRVPPYLRFVAHDQSPLRPPLAVGRHLRWKLTSITPIVVKRTLLNSGFKLVRSECDTSECPQDETIEWVGIWGKHMKSLLFRAIKDGQKMNHFPGTFQIGRKDRLWRNLQKLAAKHGTKEFGIMPKTYVLPHDMKLLKRDWDKYAARNEKWIIKPPASARGTGIAVVSRWAEIPKKRSVVVQRYIAKPYLINGSKFDLRLYVLVTSMHPVKIYLFSDGLARFASVKYTEDQATLHDRYMHLTNYSINRLSKNYTSNEDASACQGHKWTLQTLMQYLERERGVNTKELWSRLKELVIKTIISGESTIRSLTEANITSRYNCYELFGIDVLLDEDLKPWLLEVNISPSLHSSSPLDLHVKGPLVTAVLNIAQFHLPNRPPESSGTGARLHAKYAHVMYDPRMYTVYLSKEERDKHIIYAKMEERSDYMKDILSTLTPDDVRHLVQAEDELAATLASALAAPLGTPHMQRVFPTPDTHTYLEYLATPRYYNRLMDAWENKYKHDRTPGINLLRSLCDIGYHLEVPAVPIKRAPPEPACLLDACRVTRRGWRVCRGGSWRPRAANHCRRRFASDGRRMLASGGERSQ